MRHKPVLLGRKLCLEDLGNRLRNSNLPVNEKQPEVSSIELIRVFNRIHKVSLKVPK